MAFCNKCLFYIESYDEMNRNRVDIGDEDSHFCPMRKGAIPDEVYNGEKPCEFYERKDDSE